jgi:hypothetical protein
LKLKVDRHVAATRVDFDRRHVVRAQHIVDADVATRERMLLLAIDHDGHRTLAVMAHSERDKILYTRVAPTV